MIVFRQRFPILKQRAFLSEDSVQWEENDGYLELTLQETFFIAFNPRHTPYYIHKKGWSRIVDTAKQSPEDFLEHPKPVPETYELIPYSSVLFYKKV